MTQLDRDFQALTGLRYNVSQLVEGASTAEEKQKVYDYISWNIKKGRIMEKANNKALETAILDSIKNLNQNSTVDDVEETYTAEEAAAYNLTLTGALQYGAIKVTNPETESDSYDYIYDEASWNESFANGGLKKYYEWSDAANAPYKEDLWNTIENRAANINDAKKENDEYVLDANGNYVYENCERCWTGAINAPGAKYPWIVPYFDTDVNATITFQYEGKEDVMPWGDKVFGLGKKENGADRLFGCASIPTELGDEFLLDANGVTTFDLSKFTMILVGQEPILYTNEEVDVFNAQLDGAKHAGDMKE